MRWSDWVLVGLFTLGALSSVYMIGKPREPITNASAITQVVVNVLLIAMIVWAR